MQVSFLWTVDLVELRGKEAKWEVSRGGGGGGGGGEGGAILTGDFHLSGDKAVEEG